MKEEKEALGVTSARLLSSLYLGQALGALVTVMTLIIVTRLLLPTGYGVYTFAFGFMALVDFVGNFGMGTYFGRNLARYTYEKAHKKVLDTLITGYTILLPITAFLTLLGIAISPYVADVLFKNLNIQPLTLMLAASIIIFSTTESTAVQALIGFKRGKLASTVGVLVDIVQLVASVALILTARGATPALLSAAKINGAITGMLVGYVFGAALAFFLIWRIVSREGPIKLHRPSSGEIKTALSFVVPMSLNNVLNFSMVNFTVLYMSIYVSIADIGNYGAAIKGLNFIAIFYSTMSTALLPLFTTAGVSKEVGKVDDAYNKLLIYSLMVTLPFIVYVAVLAKPGARLLLSSAFGMTGIYLSLIAFGTLIDTFQYYLSNLLISKGFTTPLVKSLLVSTILQLAAVLILVPIPGVGVYGAIAAIFFIGPVTESILFIRLSKRLMNFKLDYGKTALLFASNLLLAIPLSVALLFSSALLSLITGLIILVVAYPALIVLLGVIRRPDLEELSGIAKKIPALAKPAGLVMDYLRFLLGIKGSGS